MIGVGATLGALLFAAACGGTDFSRHSSPTGPGPNPTDVAVAAPPSSEAARDAVLQAKVWAAVDRTRAWKTARTSVSVTLTGTGDDELSTGAFDIAGRGVVDLVGGDADLNLSIPLFDRLSGGGTVEQRIVGGVAYTRLPAGVVRTAGLPAGVAWLSLDRGRAQTDRAALSQSQVDPAGQLAFLAAASDDVRAVGAESVRGVIATRYTVTIAAAQLAASGSRGAVARARIARLGAALGDGPVVVDVWLDGSGCARRVVVSVPLTAPGAVRRTAAGREAMLRVQDDYFGFGTPLSVTAPLASEVRPYSRLRLAAAHG